MTITTEILRSKKNLLAFYAALDTVPASELPAIRAQVAALHAAKATGHGGSAMQAGRKRSALGWIDTLISRSAA